MSNLTSSVSLTSNKQLFTGSYCYKKMWFIAVCNFFSFFVHSVLTSVILFEDRLEECPDPSNFSHLEIEMNELKGHWFEIERSGCHRENFINCAMFYFNTFKSPKGETISIKKFRPLCC